MKDVITSFLNPKTIALIGASEKKGKVGYILMQKLLKSKSKIIPINLKQTQILTKQAYSSVLLYKEKIDLAIIAIPAKTVPQALIECGKKKIQNIIIISAGFEESGNKKLQEKLNNIKEKYSLNILGPNCFGIFNPKINLDTTFANTTPKKGSIAFLSQSGALWSYIADLDLWFSGFVSLGNMSDLSFTDFLEYFIKDKNTNKIILYIEKLKQGKKFIELCNSTKKEIIVIKAGKTKQGKEAAISHTASLATDYEIYKNAFRQAGVKQVSTIQEALNLKQEELTSELKGKELFVITNAGGAGTILTDILTQKGYKIFGPHDLLGTANANDYKSELNRIRADYDNILLILTPQSMSEPSKTAQEIVNFHNRKKIIAIFLGDKSIQDAKRILELNGIKVFTNLI
jgi:acetyltransferase